MRRSVRRASGRVPRRSGRWAAQGRRAAPKLQRLREQRRREHFPRAEHEPEGFKAHTVGAAGKDLAQYVDDGGLVDGRAGSGGQGSGRAESARGGWYPASPQTACTPAARSSLSASAFSEPSRVAAMACVSRPGSLSSAGSSGGRLSVPSSACMVRKGMFMGGLLLATAGNRTFRAPTRLGAETGLRPIRPRRSGGVRRLA